MKSFRVALLVATGAASACNGGEHTKAKPSAASPPKSVASPVRGTSACTLDMAHPGEMQRAGRARVLMNGPKVAIDLHDVPALCGPMFNADVPALGVSAGQGLLFATCLPQGMLQLGTYDERSPGKQTGHGADEPAGTEILFNHFGGSTYSSRAAVSDVITLSGDLWKADADVVLHDVAGDAELRAKITIECAESKP